jgi:hypothetical protein
VTFPSYSSDADKTVTLMGQSWPAVTATVDPGLPPFDDLGWEVDVDFVLDEGLPFALLGYEVSSIGGGQFQQVLGLLPHRAGRRVRCPAAPEALDELRRRRPELLEH